VTKASHRFTFIAALIAFVVVALWMIGPFLLSLFLGGTLALVCYPFHLWLRNRTGAVASAAASTVLLLVLVISPLAIFSFLAVRQGIEIGREMAELKEFSPRAITAVLSRSETVETLLGNPAAVNARLKSVIQAAGQLTSAAVVNLGKGVPEFVFQMSLALMAFFFFLLDGARFMDWLLGLDILDRGVQHKLVDAFRDTTISAVLAGLAAASSQALLISLGFLVLGVPGAFLAGGATFILAWIPVLGSFPASLAGMLYLYAQGEPTKMALMAGLAVGASLIDNVVRPLVLKGRADMHPLVGLVAIIGGIEMFGILGVFLGPIMAAMLLALLRIFPAGL